MPSMVSMKEDNDDSLCGSYYTPSKYPYGLQIYLNEDQCDALGITKSIKAGTEITLTCRALVISSTESLDTDNDSKTNDISLSLQITDMGAKVQGVVRNAAAELYGAD